MPAQNRNIRSARFAQRSDISAWVKRETPHQRKSLETASRHFDRNDAMDVHTLEAVYAQESSFGQSRGRRNATGPAGDFQLKRNVAQKMGLHVSKANDERFDLDAASAAAAKLLKTSDSRFSKATTLTKGLKTTQVEDAVERKHFSLAAYNAGDARIAGAQKLAFEAGEDPTKWKNVKKYLEKAGATKRQADETRDYIDMISSHEREFEKGSKADANAKFKKTKPIEKYPPGRHWVTIDGRHILIKD
ncbi:MAG: transglycosylase SLT domain-containing protein [Deltaproteobacteria bacterium]|nr:transglycosylase SLT domain-containing protein [Deltaproteobacteria bacterium]